LGTKVNIVDMFNYEFPTTWSSSEVSHAIIFTKKEFMLLPLHALVS